MLLCRLYSQHGCWEIATFNGYIFKWKTPGTKWGILQPCLITVIITFLQFLSIFLRPWGSHECKERTIIAVITWHSKISLWNSTNGRYA